MRMMTFAKRNFKELIRDPLNLSFLFGFPIVLLLLLSAIQANIPVSMFEIEHLSPGIAVFGLSFMTLFSATIIAKDRQSSFMHRLYTTPMTPMDFILGYTLPLIPIAMAEGVACYIFAIILKLEISLNILTVDYSRNSRNIIFFCSIYSKLIFNSLYGSYSCFLGFI